MNNYKIAVLIDGDNANSKCIEQTLAQIAEHGEIVLKRVYGDWSQSQLNSWKHVVNKFSIKAIQAFSYTKGKNSTDIALIIDAMDILYSYNVNAFCIVSSDCDFTGLIHRIKENGCYAIGIGKEYSCNSFKCACDTFLLEDRAAKSVTTTEEVMKNIAGNSAEEIYRVKAETLPGLKIVGKIDLINTKS